MFNLHILSRRKDQIVPVSIRDCDMKRVDSYKYLIYIDDNLSWTKNPEMMYKKAQSTLLLEKTKVLQHVQ